MNCVMAAKIQLTTTFLVIMLLSINHIACGPSGQAKLDENFKNFAGTIVVYDQQTDTQTIFNEERAATRFSPFSTFKIPNSIIALETEVVSDIDQTLNWDRQKYPAEDWWPKIWSADNNLERAIKYSVVPAYRHVASLIGAEKVKRYVVDFDYGNKDISSGIDSFWLGGSLKISALEQIAFLKKFYNGQLNISSRTSRLVKAILIQEQEKGYTLSGKTGAGTIDQEQNAALGWYVGYVEKGNNVYYFALNIEGDNFNEILKPRIEITRNILKQLGIIQ